MLATNFGTRFGTFTDAVRDVLNELLNYDIGHENTIQEIKSFAAYKQGRQ